MGAVKQRISSVLLKKCMGYIEKNPLENLPKLINIFEKLVNEEEYKQPLARFRKILQEPENNWNIFVQRILADLNINVRTKILINFYLNTEITGAAITKELEEKHNCNIPRAILLDPTAACNLKCTGCWAGDYNKADSLEYELLDRIINEGKKMGIYIYIYSGGEPLLRKADLVQLAEKHSDCLFLAFTNGTLVDEQFCRELARMGNLLLAISVEGYEAETDLRRGQGTYAKVITAMELLKEYGVAFGFSTCYHRKNTDVVGSDAYVDLMIEKGCMFGWYFTYIPIGKGAVTDLMVTPEQREFMYHRLHALRETKPIFLVDFWNDGAFVDGCIAGGRLYLHINARGDVEPCAFIHYSNVNIREAGLLDAFKSPLLIEYRKNHPFNRNHLRPCPLLDNPDILKAMVHDSQARSTQPLDREEVDALTDKCRDASKEWAQVADRLWGKV